MFISSQCQRADSRGPLNSYSEMYSYSLRYGIFRSIISHSTIPPVVSRLSIPVSYISHVLSIESPRTNDSRRLAFRASLRPSEGARARARTTQLCK